MSITDELREWGRATLMPSLLVRMEAIADRIDAEHEKACDDAWDNGYEADYLGIEKWLTEHPQVMEHHGWVRLPKDADGDYIHIGDVMEWVPYDDTYPTVVRKVVAVGADVFFAWSDEKQGYAQYEACAYRHHHAPTVEDVLREFANEVYADADNEIRDRDFLCAKYAKRLTLAEGEDA